MDYVSRRDFYQRRCLGAAFFLLLAYAVIVEWAVYFLSPWWSWPTLPLRNEINTRVLVVGDPQLLGLVNTAPGFFGAVELWDADRYIRKTFRRVHRFFKPHVVLFLGDVFDEAEFATDAHFGIYFKRFLSVFSDLNMAQAIIIPGDNDIGGEVTPPKKRIIRRFNRYFRSDPVVSHDKIDFVKVCYVTRSYAYRAFLRDKADHVRVVVSHLPLTPTYGSYVKDIVREIEPDLIFSGHDHLSEYIATGRANKMVEKMALRFTMDLVAARLNLSDGHVHEIQVPTCSYRMGTYNVGYGAAIIDPDRIVTYGVLWSPQRLAHLFGYLVVLTISLLLVLVAVTSPQSVLYLKIMFCRKHT
uniref:Putative cell division control protein/ dna repair exonuclease n=1 Tax=Ornithodoros turicata TaxID=34597 RepID=A0A2R5L7J8_9ACAR